MINVLLSLILFSISISLAIFTIYTLRHRSRSYFSTILAFFMISLLLYAAGYGGELLSSNIPMMRAWSMVQYLGLAFMPYLWIRLTAIYVNAGFLKALPTRLVLFALSLVTLFGAVSDPWLHLKYATVSIGYTLGFPVLQFTQGPLYYFHVIYSFCSYFVGTGLLLFFLLSTSRLLRKNLLLMIAGSAIPWANYMLYLSDIRIEGIDTTPFTMFISVIFFGSALFSSKLLDSSPIARSAIFEIISDPVLVVDPHGNIADYNKAAESLFPCLTDPATDTGSLDEILTGVTLPEFETSLNVAGEDRRFSCRITKINSTIVHMDNAMGSIILFKDITEAARLLERVQELASVDSLTGLFNRRHFFDLADKSVAHLVRSGEPLSFIIADLDHFKDLNDTYGHLAGDEIIRTTAAIIAASVRPSDITARFGGEEFVCLMPDTRPEEAYVVAERIRHRIENTAVSVPDGASGSACLSAGRVTLSLGVAGRKQVDKQFTLTDFIADADRALYASKREGRNRTTLA